MNAGFWYLASPYSLYTRGRDAAAADAAREVGVLLKAGVIAFSPIAHSHAVAEATGLDPGDHGLWIPADTPFMAAATGLIMCRLPGWEQSLGMAMELDYFVRAQKPVVYMDPGVVPDAFRAPAFASHSPATT